MNQTETDIALSPASATVSVGGMQQFTATAQDQFGQAMLNQPAFMWTVDTGGAGGTIGTTGVYIAPSRIGSDTVIATDTSTS